MSLIDKNYVAPLMVVEEKDGVVHNVVVSACFDSSLRKSSIFNKPEQLIEKINDTVNRVSYFCSKLVNIDEFTGKRYEDEDDIPIDELKKSPNGYLGCNKIIGSSTFTNYNYGTIDYHSSNSLLFKYACLQFMLNNYSIPIEFTNLDDKKIYKFKRSSGDINLGMIKENSSLRFSKTLDCIVINIKFDPDINIEDDVDSFYKSFTYMEKSIPLKQFMELNDIPSFTIQIPNYYLEYDEELRKGNIICPCSISERVLTLTNIHYLYQSHLHLEKMTLTLLDGEFKVSPIEKECLIVYI